MTTDTMTPHARTDPRPVARRRTARIAGSAAVVAGLLWVASGILNRIALSSVPVPSQVVNLLVPAALDLGLRRGEHQVGFMAVIGFVAMALVVAGVTYLAARDLASGHGRWAVFFAAWFATVAGSMTGSTVQVLAEVGRVLGFQGFSLRALGDMANALIPYLTGGGYWGVALGWLVGLTAVITLARVAREPAAAVPGEPREAPQHA